MLRRGRGTLSRRYGSTTKAAGVALLSPDGNDATIRALIWRRFEGDEWAAFDALPPAIRRRLHAHAYDAWSVNALMLWRLFRRQLASSPRAERRLLRYLDECEVLERDAFAQAYRARWKAELPHVAARATVQRYERPGGAEAPTFTRHCGPAAMRPPG